MHKGNRIPISLQAKSALILWLSIVTAKVAYAQYTTADFVEYVNNIAGLRQGVGSPPPAVYYLFLGSN
jgi:hypothetical protein